MDNLLNVAVVTLPFSDVAGDAILGNYIDLLEPLAGQIYVITGKFSERPNNNIHIVRVGADIGKREPMLTKIARILLTQVKYCHHLFTVSRNVDVVIFYIGTRLYLLPILLAKLLRKKVIIVATGRQSVTAKSDLSGLLLGLGGMILPPVFRTVENINFLLADQIISESKSGINTLELHRYVSKIRIVGQYVDTDIWTIRTIPRDRKNLVGYIGALAPRKGVLNFVESIPLVLAQRRDIRFLIGGDGPLFSQIRGDLDDNNLQDKVMMVGWIPHSQVPAWLNELKLLVVPSYHEALPIIAQQAMACGAVLLSTLVGAIPEWIKDGETGFILEDNSPQCIAEGVGRALACEKLDEIARNARLVIERGYTYEATVANFRSALRDLTGSDGNG